MNYSWLYAIGVVLLALFLPVFSYLTLIYRELGRMTTGPIHEHLDIFEAEIEPKLKINRRSAGRAFRILGHFWLAFLVLETTRGVLFFAGTWEQVVEFSDKRVREVMTPRPDIVTISADVTLEELHTKFVETGFTRLPVFENTIDDIVGVAHAQDMLTIADADLPRRKVRDFMKPVLFIPETKVGSQLLKEMRQKGQTIAVVIDEHGSVAGIATMEDLVEEIVGEIGDETAEQVGDIIKEPDGAMILPGGLAISEVEELLGIQFGESAAETVTTLAGLLSHASGKVPAPGDKIDLGGYRFEVLDANQTKVLSVRIRKQKAPVGEATKATAQIPFSSSSLLSWY